MSSTLHLSIYLLRYPISAVPLKITPPEAILIGRDHTRGVPLDLQEGILLEAFLLHALPALLSIKDIGTCTRWTIDGGCCKRWQVTDQTINDRYVS